MNTEEAYVALIQYPGIGVKTAACVILFCLQRPCYAVDTHVWRLTKDLGWVPPKANEIKTFAHCQVRVPDEYKYKLHQLFWHHGQECVRCRADTTKKSKGWDEGCPIDHLVTRVRKVRKVVVLAANVKEKTEDEAETEDREVLDLVDEDEVPESDAISTDPNVSLVENETVVQTRYATRSRKGPGAVVPI
jgi:DNA-(apurinic or apyrimidinic site) lyase